MYKPLSIQELKSRVNANGKLELTELVEVCVLALFFLQKLGKAPNNEIAKKLEENDAVVNEHLLASAMEALQARGLISYATGRTPLGQTQKSWKIRQIVWSAPPEVAHIIDLLPNLVATEEARAILSAMNGQEEEGDGESKAQRKLKFDDYVAVEIEFVTLDPILGSQPSSPQLKRLIAKQPNGIDADCLFSRDNDGVPIIGSDAVKGWLRTGLRTAGYAESAAEYFACSSVRLEDAKIEQLSLPVIDPRTRQGKGIQNYESIAAGQKIKLRLQMPGRGVMTVDEFKVWLAAYCIAPLRGMSPARGARYGKLAMTSFTVLGLSSDGKAVLESVLADPKCALPPEALKFAQGLVAKH